GKAEADKRAGVFWKQLERMPEHPDGLAAIAFLEGGEAGAVVRVHREFGRVQLRRSDSDLAIEFCTRFTHVSPRKPHEAEQPMQAFRRVALLQVCLTVLDDRPLAQDRFRAVERSARDMDHRRFEVSE